MSQSRRTIEQLLKQGRLPLSNAEAAARHLQVYPSAHTWRTFFDRAALIIGVIALALALVFFIAYNWQDLGKMGKFALVEGALAMTIALYVALSFRKRYRLIRQLLLLIASIITGSLLALFGQVYQTGADTWQLFFGWAVLIIPWVVIARFPALWLLWLGLVNAALTLYLDVIDISFLTYEYQDVFRIGLLALLNFVALNLWLLFIDKEVTDNRIIDKQVSNKEAMPLTNSTLNKTTLPLKSDVHWSTYVVGLLSTFFSTLLAFVTIFDEINTASTLIAFLLWGSWCAFMYWRFYLRNINLLMLTYLCGSIITVIMSWSSRIFLDNFDFGGFLILALLLIGMSSYAVVWLRKVTRLKSENNVATAIVRGDSDE